VDGNQSYDEYVVNCRVVVVAKHPSVIKCGISCIVLEKCSVHLHNALSLSSLSAGTRYELSKAKAE
jgi:hypothetical protein